MHTSHEKSTQVRRPHMRPFRFTRLTPALSVQFTPHSPSADAPASKDAIKPARQKIAWIMNCAAKCRLEVAFPASGQPVSHRRFASTTHRNVQLSRCSKSYDGRMSCYTERSATSGLMPCCGTEVTLRFFMTAICCSEPVGIQ